jgi:mannose/cellobiose epimerase-like protein (N-acyl-D-glucosamine 2-epimerase family)
MSGRIAWRAIDRTRCGRASGSPQLWFDQLMADDCFVTKSARTSSLYHIVGALA